MSRVMEVIGDDIMGDIMGDDDDDEVVGLVTRTGAVLAPGSARRGGMPGPRGGSRMIKANNRPQWRDQLAPGVIQADEGMIPLVLQAQAGSPAGTFSATLTQIEFRGTLQKPYRAERLLASTVRVGTTSVGRLLALPFIGTDLMLADINAFDVELVGAANSFGTRLTMKAAEPGVLIRFLVNLSTPLTGTDTIFATIMLLGRVVH